MKKLGCWLVVVAFLLMGLATVTAAHAQVTPLPEPETVQPPEEQGEIFKIILDLFGREVTVPASTPDRERFGPPALIRQGEEGFIYFIYVREGKVVYIEAYTSRYTFLVSVGWREADAENFRVAEDIGLGTPFLTGVLILKNLSPSEEKEEDHSSPPPKPISGFSI